MADGEWTRGTWWNCSVSISEGVVRTWEVCHRRAESVWVWQQVRDWCRAENTLATHSSRIFSPAYRRTLETEVSVRDVIMTLLNLVS